MFVVRECVSSSKECKNNHLASLGKEPLLLTRQEKQDDWNTNPVTITGKCTLPLLLFNLKHPIRFFISPLLEKFDQSRSVLNVFLVNIFALWHVGKNTRNTVSVILWLEKYSRFWDVTRPFKINYQFLKPFCICRNFWYTQDIHLLKSINRTI